MDVCMVSLYGCIGACTHLGNGTGHITVTMAAPLLHTSDPVRYEAVLQSCGTRPVVHTHCDFIVLLHWDIRPPAS